MSKSKDAPSTTGEIDVESLELPSKRHEILGVITSLVALVLLLALVSYDGMDASGAPIPGGNIVGKAGVWMAFLFYTLFGAASYIVDLFIWAFAFCLFTGRADRLTPKGIASSAVISVLSAIELNSLLLDTLIAGGHTPGGFAGSILGSVGISLFSIAGTHILTLGGIVVTVLVITDLSLFLIGRAVGQSLSAFFLSAFSVSARVVRAWMNEIPADGPESVVAPPVPITPGFSPKSPRRKLAPNESPVEESDTEEDETVEAEIEKPKIVTAKAASRVSPVRNDAELVMNPPVKGEFLLPPLSLLSPPEPRSSNLDESHLQEMAQRLMKVLADFKIVGEVREIHPGPVVTMFEFAPRSGTKLSIIAGLANEVAMALEVKRVRVVAPIPGKNAVGFELPNKNREMVKFREIIEDETFSHSKGKLPMALGKDIAGMPFTADLAKMPHLLMSGTTGSGKSVTVNTMILSFLFKYTPEELRLLLIDPKMIEFQPYNHIPHLLLPVVTDMSKACLALKWAVDEMERRYHLFADIGSKNLESYNARVEKIRAVAEEKMKTPVAAAETAIAPDGTVIEFGEIPYIPGKLPTKLPLIVICIDELADLMMVAAKDVETSIARLAQKARAAGLHLIVATQRPSTDVVTGLIKANFPARLACQVASAIDSRTILNTNGAESLLGNGDMLIMPPGTADLMRIQGAFVSEEEVAGIVEFLKKQGLPQYDEEILKPRDEESSGVSDEDKDEVYDQAVAIVAEEQACSISMIQRRLKIGYNRAANIVEIMEKEGVVGPANGVNKREVLIGPQ